MHKAFDIIIGCLVLLCGILLILSSFRAYDRDLRFERGVVDPSIELQNLNEIGTSTSAEECLREHKIPSVIRDGIIYINEEDSDYAIWSCA